MTIGAASRLELNGHETTDSIQMPTVDIIIVNRNYSQFIGETIRSLKEQTHPLFNCDIIDNGSTDDSVSVIENDIDGDGRFRLTRLDRNFGHIGAALKALKLSSNEFVVFADADDVMFPNFLAAHLQTHIGSRGVAVTTNNLFEIDAVGRILTGSMSFFAQGLNDLEVGLRPKELIPRIPSVSEDDLDRLHDATIYVPNTRKGWFWAPGTGNMFRRSVINLFAFDDRDDPQMGGVDCAFTHVLHAVTGTMIINMNLSARRIHGSNDNARIPILVNVDSGNPVAERESTALRKKILSTVMQRVDKLSEHINPATFFSIFDHVPNRHQKELRYFLDKIAPLIAQHFPKLVAVLGERIVIGELRQRLSFKSMKLILRENNASAATWRRLYRLEAKRLCRAFARSAKKRLGIKVT